LLANNVISSSRDGVPSETLVGLCAESIVSDDKLGKLWKKAIMTYFEALSQHLAGKKTYKT
jgi:hypothetical protein